MRNKVYLNFEKILNALDKRSKYKKKVSPFWPETRCGLVGHRQLTRFLDGGVKFGLGGEEKTMCHSCAGY